MANATIPHPIDDDAVVRRLYACGTWKLEAVAHFGGDETGNADMCLLLDAEGKPFIQGASIAGAVRSFLARQSQPWSDYTDGKECRQFKDFFGGSDEKDPMSALIVADAPCVCEQLKISIRDGVRVSAETGAAADKAKFDVEVVERGTEFTLHLECIIRHKDDTAAMTQLFCAVLYAFQHGKIRLGARTRRGYGRGKITSWEIRDLDMKEPADVIAWLRNDPWSRNQSSLQPSALPTDKRCYFRIEADFKLRTSLLIRSSSEDPQAPDMVHLHSIDEPVVPGTSFAGAFRHRAAIIADTLDWTEGALEKMFGPVHNQQDTEQQDNLWASRIWIEEQLVKNVEMRWQDRVAIDRFTGGSLQNALFNEKPVYPVSIADLEREASTSHLRLILTLDEPKVAEIGLLLLTLRDFWHGHATLGGETSNGRGTLKGVEASLYEKKSDITETQIVTFSSTNSRMTLEKGDAAYLKECITEAQGYQGGSENSQPAE